jgi:hypothetical protein
MGEQDDLFAGRIVTVYTSWQGERGRGVVMRDCSHRKLGGRAFIVGTTVEATRKKKSKGRWWVGVQTAIPIDSVASAHFMTQEQFEERKKRR